jgi:hypothetical protein
MVSTWLSGSAASIREAIFRSPLTALRESLLVRSARFARPLSAKPACRLTCHRVLLESGQELRMSRYQQQVAERLGLHRLTGR